MSLFTLSAFTDEYGASPDEQFSALRQTGIPLMELRSLNGVNVSELTAADISALAARAKDEGVAFSAIGSPIGKIPLDGGITVHLELAERIFTFASMLGTGFVRIFSFYPPKAGTREDRFEKTAALLRQLTALAGKFGLTLCHENEAGIFGESPEDELRLLQAVPELRTVFDMGNFMLSGYDPLSAFDLLKDKIAYFHIKDGNARGEIYPPTCGEAKIEELLTRYRNEVGKAAILTLEPHLCDFAVLSSLTKEKYETPYRFRDAKEAFLFAAGAVENLLKRIDP